MKTVIVSALFVSLIFSAVAESAEKRPLEKQKKPVAALAEKNKSIDPVTGMEFVYVKGGCFQMGDVSGDGGNDEKPAHEVCVSDYYIGKGEVTQGQWEKVMKSNPSLRLECGPDCPVESVSWNDVQDYITKLNSLGKMKFRLPTEAEWEYAARSGGKSEKWAGINDEKLLADYAWYDKSSVSKAHRRGEKRPNGLGLLDMTGNVSEWCQDWYSETYYGSSPKDNPAGPTDGIKRGLRGGGFYDSAMNSRTTTRLNDEPGIRDYSYGVRLVRSSK